MPYEDTIIPLETLLEQALKLEKRISKAIATHDNDTVDKLSTQLETIISNILSFSTASLSDLKHKCSFGEKLILPDHNDPDNVTNIFSKLIQDIEHLDIIYAR